MEELQKLIHDALIEKWAEIKQFPNRFFFKPESEGVEEIISFEPPRSVSLVIKDDDRVNVELYKSESATRLRQESADFRLSQLRSPFEKFSVKNIVNSHGKYYIEHQSSEGAGLVDYWSLSELCDQIEKAFSSHEGGGISSGG